MHVGFHDCVRLSIEDTGCGMPPEIVGRIFDPFFTTRQVGEGTGLGLTVVHSIVSEHGGHIDVTSHVGEGTRLDIHFPIAQAGATEVVPLERFTA